MPLKFVGGQQLLELYAWRAPVPDHVDNSDKLSGEVTIGAMRTIEKPFGVAAGQTVSWAFTVHPGMWMLPEVDVLMHATSLPDDAEDDTLGFEKAFEIGINFVVEPTMIKSKMGEQTGSWTANKGGIFCLVWSNLHSWVRSKTVTFNIEPGSKPKGIATEESVDKSGAVATEDSVSPKASMEQPIPTFR